MGRDDLIVLENAAPFCCLPTGQLLTVFKKTIILISFFACAVAQGAVLTIATDSNWEPLDASVPNMMPQGLLAIPVEERPTLVDASICEGMNAWATALFYPKPDEFSQQSYVNMMGGLESGLTKSGMPFFVSFSFELHLCHS